MKTPLALIVAATSVFVFTQAADAQCDCQQTVSYYAPDATTAYYAPTTAYYAPTTAYYAPTTAYYAPTTTYYAPTTATTLRLLLLRSDHCLLRSDHCVLSNCGVLRPTTAYYGGGGYNGGYYRGGAFGTGLGGWAGVRGIDRRWDRRGW